MGGGAMGQRGVGVVALALVVALSAVRARSEPYPEGRRFDARAFYAGLKKRGLTDLLSLHLREHPPADELDALLLARDIKLAEYADPSRSAAQRTQAIAEANRLLESLIERHSDHKQARAWRIELGRSLLYVEAERYTSNILYRGGTARDRAALAPLMDRALAVLGTLLEQLSATYDGLDELSAPQYDRLENKGEIAKLEQDIALVDYLLGWVRFYRALARDADDPERERELREVLDYLTDRSNLLDTAHATTHYQGQALLLAGMTERQLGKHTQCRKRLARAIDVVAGVRDDAERRELRWVVTLARIELVRSFTQAGSFKRAKEAVDVFRERISRKGEADFETRLIVALLERSVLRAEADRIEAEGRSGDARVLRERAVDELARQARQDDAQRDGIYAALYDMVKDVDTRSLSGFECCAVVAGALGEADEMTAAIDRRRSADVEAKRSEILAIEERRAAILDHAIVTAESVLQPDYDIAHELRAEAAFNLGVALYARGRRLEAARSFLRVARDHPDFFRALDAATFAVQLSWELQQDPASGSRSDIQALNLEALTTLTEGYAGSDRAEYWQFFLGQHLARLGRFAEAAEAYSRVSPDHEQYAESTYLAAESRVEALRRMAATDAKSRASIGGETTTALLSAKSAQQQLARALATTTDPSRQDALRRLAARATLLVGELCVIPGVDRFDRALEAVDGFERQFPQQTELIGRVLRVRMIALESSGRVDEASQLIPQYVANDPHGAVPTLQGLFDALGEEIERDKRAGRMDEAHDRAASAVVIADGIYEVAQRGGASFGPEAVYALRLQLAESALEAGDAARAGVLFRECVAEDGRRHEDGEARDSRAIFGSAESYYQLEDYAAALPLFNRVFRGAKRGESIWWRSLLRDLQCRTQLQEDPAGIVKAILQHKYFDREMGGRELRRKFDALLTANERRVERRR